jgi:hypothetical protein
MAYSIQWAFKTSKLSSTIDGNHVPQHKSVSSTLDISYFTVGIHQIQLERDTG